MGKSLTKCCKNKSDEKKLEEPNSNGVASFSNGVSNGCKKPISDKEVGKVKQDDAATSSIVGKDFAGLNTSTQPLIGDTLDGAEEEEEEEEEGAVFDEPIDQNFYYKMDHKRRGLALIFNHEIFDCNSSRRGTHIDRDRLLRTLELLDFDVKIFENETITEIKGVLEEIAALDHSDCDCLMVVILSHGDIVPLVDRRGKSFSTILTHDLVSYLHAADNKYPLQTIWEFFTDDKCPSLKNKPRIFFVTACQGDNSDEGYGVPLESSRRIAQLARDTTPFSSTKYKPFEAVKIDRSKILPQKDFLIVYSTFPGCLSYRDTLKGTWFIEALCKVLDKRKHEMDINHILTEVNRTVAIDYETYPDALKQMPCICSMLRKRLVFPKKVKRVTNGF